MQQQLQAVFVCADFGVAKAVYQAALAGGRPYLPPDAAHLE